MCVYFRGNVTYHPKLGDTALTGRLQPGAHAAAGPVNYPGIGKWAGPPPLASARDATTFWMALSAICGGHAVTRVGAGVERCGGGGPRAPPPRGGGLTGPAPPPPPFSKTRGENPPPGGTWERKQEP